ncbi:MAG: hypothetical protein HY558_00830 [Euryarchaeota archaeon]|nr:hypothetical protein [Euryarchaeota archaeon]
MDPCIVHPGAPAVGRCQICRQPVCGGCHVLISNRVFCRSHGAKGYKMQQKMAL